MVLIGRSSPLLAPIAVITTLLVLAIMFIIVYLIRQHNLRRVHDDVLFFDAYSDSDVEAESDSVTTAPFDTECAVVHDNPLFVAQFNTHENPLYIGKS